MEQSSKKIILRLDASACSKASCILQLYRLVVEGWRGKRIPNDIHYGSAFHVFKETITTSRDETKAIRAALELFQNTENVFVKPKKEYLDANHLVRTCMDYTRKFGVDRSKDDFQTLDFNGTPLVEKKFSIPYYVDDILEVLLQGTIDDIGKYRNNGCFAYADEKTTASWDSTGYLRGYQLSHQLLFYRFAIEWFAEHYPDSIFKQITKDKLGAVINGVFVSPTKPTEFKRSDIFWFHQSQLDEFRVGLDDLVLKLVHYVRAKSRPHRQGLVNGACKTQYGPCDFAISCKMKNDEEMDAMLEQNFVKGEYNPLLFGGGQVKK